MVSGNKSTLNFENCFEYETARTLNQALVRWIRKSYQVVFKTGGILLDPESST
jgi:hypothetical protein